jgi:hypothetical protein
MVEAVAGPTWKSLKAKAEADGCLEPSGVQVGIRLFEPEKRVEFHFAVRKAPVTAPEAV